MQNKVHTVESGVEIPKEPRNNPKPLRYPFAQMDVGDSFLVECPDERKSAVRSNVATSAWKHSLLHYYGNRKYITRKVEGGVRVWRIE